MSRHTRGGVRGAIAERLVEESGKPGLLILMGARGSGTSGVLADVLHVCGAAEIPSFLVSMRDAAAAEVLAQQPLTALHLVDDLEFATPDALEALANRLRLGGRGACALVEDHLTAERSSEPGWRALFAPETELPLTRYVHLVPLSALESLRIITETSSEYVDAHTVVTLHGLSFGRPAWLLELLQLEAMGALQATPWPGLSATQVRELGLDTFRFADDRAATHLAPEVVAAGAALARLDPRTLSGHGDLISGASTSALLTHGLLVTIPGDASMYAVPELYAAALQLRADPALLARVSNQISERLQMQELLGIQLSEREAYFCATADEAASDATVGDPARAALHHRVASEFLAFGGTGEVRDLLLRGAALGLRLDPLERSRVATALHGPLAGMRSLQAAQEHPKNLAEHIAFDALASYVVANAPVPHDSLRVSVGSGAKPSSDDDAPAARWLLDRWNALGPIDSDAQRIARIADRHPVAEIALLARLLLDLEQVKRGLQPQTSSDCVARITQITGIAMTSPPELRDLLTTAVVAEAMIAFYLGDTSGSDVALDALTDSLPAAALHHRWLMHLGAAGKAILAGDISRAALEWKHLVAHLPHFLPVRLDTLISDVGAAIERASIGSAAIGENESSTDIDDLSSQYLAYFSGLLEHIGPRIQRYGFLHDAPVDDARSLDIPRLARAHIQATNAQNPAALITVAEHLAERHFWGPAAYALREARRIFVQRRATGSVNRCSELLTELEHAAQLTDPWFSIEALPEVEFARLTPRELATARLSVDGLSNKEMAAHLRCSVRTVESHLAQARAKLGASDREELAEIMREFAQPEAPRNPRHQFRVDSRTIEHMR
ncbi:helix-turn-helix transcriptional regulator [Leucobacter musarum]|uniref:helix-turn-helix transcriptional regulator n=1 Tax=Leucobacter musarum TaxID=1930747 RepID=UPI000A5012AE|nr:LuxR family transcriptional regulator [Leucobacter musarum]